MPKKFELLDRDKDDLCGSGLEDETIRESGIVTITDKKEIAKRLNIAESSPLCRPGMWIPYRDLDGKLNSYGVLKPHVAPMNGDGKPLKYITPTGLPTRIYLPADTIVHLKSAHPQRIITEGAKKALLLAQLGYAAIGLSGVWCWKQTGTQKLKEELVALGWEDIESWVCFDWDPKEVSRNNVDQAANYFAAALKREGSGTVYRVVLPPGDNGEKQGVDDYFVVHGEEALEGRIAEAQGILGTDKYNVITCPSLGAGAYYGVLGEYVRKIDGNTEATAAAMLGHLLVMVGTYIGPNHYIEWEEKQRARINLVVGGPTSVGRKGTSKYHALTLLRRCDPDFFDKQVRSGGMSSGEGIIVAVMDKEITVTVEPPEEEPLPAPKDGEPVATEPVAKEKKKKPVAKKETKIIPVDKRLCLIEPEFANVCAMCKREGSSLSVVIRQAFDGDGNLSNLIVEPREAYGAHISIVGHITQQELNAKFSALDQANGFGNRFLWFAVKSEKCITRPLPVSAKVLQSFTTRLLSVLITAANQVEPRQYKLTEPALEWWDREYPPMREEQPGALGTMMSRGPTFVLRIALIFAILDGSRTIEVAHLDAAMAIWKFSCQSAVYLMGKQTASGFAERLCRTIAKAKPGEGMARKEMFKHHGKTAEEFAEALAELLAAGRIRRVDKRTGKVGKPPEVYEAIN
jgi:hypothetical protein